MSVTIDSFLKRGYTPLACNRYAGIAWQGEYLDDFWMWNRQLTEYKGGIKRMQTVRVADLKEAAMRYWRDRWVPLKPVGTEFLRRMEAVLRAHQGLKKEGVCLPDGEFLRMPEPIPDEFMGTEVRAYLGMEDRAEGPLVSENTAPEWAIESYRQTKGRG
ncbi:MAG: hypothetical protein Q8P48_07395 [Deltaproteobacteria bacterium]|nr:hypothetical protein [Deltaproteobacteria bacterium]